MDHILDNPAWNALTTGNVNLANGNERVQYFDKEVSPFVALKDNSADNFRELYDIMPPDRPVLIVMPQQMETPVPWKLLGYTHGLQMVYEGDAPLAKADIELTPLTIEHVPQMMALTKLTNPGPFAIRTIDFGHYYGVFDGDKLVAMTGQRMHPYNYAEVSAVCTHPDHLGKEYARQLLLFHLHRIKAAGEVPILHVRYDNDRAIKVYEGLGFKVRQPMYFYAIQK